MLKKKKVRPRGTQHQGLDQWSQKPVFILQPLCIRCLIILGLGGLSPFLYLSYVISTELGLVFGGIFPRMRLLSRTRLKGRSARFFRSVNFTLGISGPFLD